MNTQPPRMFGNILPQDTPDCSLVEREPEEKYLPRTPNIHALLRILVTGLGLAWRMKSLSLTYSRRHPSPLDKLAGARRRHCVYMLHTVGFGNISQQDTPRRS
jgi:hypothetical protein